ncbi:NAD-dependent protein deacylase [Anaeromicropila herbilytica]|uniref:protein acetyllysine N-acetyltransferase n=1 Tax=Anaeromicropila herbilytica TaxID=2785025 RepID=A0A7R7IBF0_9FIRM|nr:NAD-dependent protein deacylase [Anaeromicropila herbilytica]BCN28714.1 NAD-dependent protein deacetylase [Anaeromicropila herbilytica]
MNLVSEFRNIINNSNNIVFFGGAGVSTESGIPDFRSENGIYNDEYSYPPETILSHSFFISKKNEFYKFYKNKMICLDAKPNITHYKLVELENKNKLKAIITQNIDGLHQIAGSKNVLELHGSVHRNYCTKCKKNYNAQYILDSTDIPRCSCGGDIKPDVVLYEEGLDMNIVEKSIEFISNAETLIVAGTSLAVYPAAGLIQHYKGKQLILINKSATPYDDRANLLLRYSLGEIFSSI